MQGGILIKLKRLRPCLKRLNNFILIISFKAVLYIMQQAETHLA